MTTKPETSAGTGRRSDGDPIDEILSRYGDGDPMGVRRRQVVVGTMGRNLVLQAKLGPGQAG